MVWTPRARPEWVQATNALGADSGDVDRLAPIDGPALIDAARRATGLDDFGADDWRDPFGVFVDSLHNEAELHTVGRLLARAEIVRALSNRLEITRAHAVDDRIAERPVVAPTLVTGTGRSGTSLLLELMACDPALRAPLTWEMLYPEAVHVPEQRADALERAHRDVTYWNLVTPEYQSMHENGGDHPNECIFMTQPTFVSDHWMGSYPAPSYGKWLARADRHASFEFHRQFLQYLQGDDQDTSWLLKAPSHLSQLRTFFDTYPDARVVITHRDPLRVLGSITDLMATLQWQRSDRVDYAAIVRNVSFGTAIVFDLLDQWRADGTLPDDRIVDVRYCDLVADPIGTVRSTYAHLDRELTPAALAAMQSYLDERSAQRAATAHHDYSFADTGLDYEATRAQFAAYTDRFDLPQEVAP